MRKINLSNTKSSLKRTFCTAIKIKEIKDPQKDLKVEYKPFFFKYQNIEYKAEIPRNFDQSLKEFLDIFAKDRSITVNRRLSHKSFEANRGNKYLPMNLLINSLKTKTNENYPQTVNILDDDLNLNNIRYRNLNHLRTPFESASQTLQTFLNGFIQSITLNQSDLGSQLMKEMLKSLGEIRGNRTKTLIAVANFMDKIQSSSDRKVSLNIQTNFNLKMEDFNKNDKENLFLVQNLQNGVNVPINIVNYKSDTEKTQKFDEEIIDNLDSLRKIAIKYNCTSNFGLVTDFYNWKINYYRKPDNNLIEEPSNYSTSLKYILPVTADFVSENTYNILLKVLTGIVTIDQDKMNSVKF